MADPPSPGSPGLPGRLVVPGRTDPIRGALASARAAIAGVSTGTRHFAVLGILAALLVAVGMMGLSGMEETRRSMETIYKDRVVPLHELKTVSDKYEIDIVESALEIQRGTTRWEAARDRVDRAVQAISASWSTYLSTYMVEDETRQIDAFLPTKARADAAVVRLRAILGAKDETGLEGFIERDTPTLRAVAVAIGHLVDLQLEVTRDEYRRAAARYDRTRRAASVSIGLGLALAVLLAVGNARLFGDLERSYDELSRTHGELVKRERLAAVGELAAAVAHEVRNPLAVIFNSLVALRRAPAASGEAEPLLGIIEEEADRLNRMVGDFLDFARPSEPALRVESLEGVISSATEAVLRAMPHQPIEIQVEPPREPLRPLSMDARMVRQALINLLVNAVQALPRGGRILIRSAEERQGDRTFARIEVIDDGPGVPAPLAEKIFQPFFTTKAMGTGLGLAVVKRIVDAHRGEVTLAPDEGHGATFTVRLPMS